MRKCFCASKASKLRTSCSSVTRGCLRVCTSCGFVLSGICLGPSPAPLVCGRLSPPPASTLRFSSHRHTLLCIPPTLVLSSSIFNHQIDSCLCKLPRDTMLLHLRSLQPVTCRFFHPTRIQTGNTCMYVMYVLHNRDAY
jgi:hypothetical protein